jgi:ribosomal protein S18 acetylase RimI-like enzyme
MEITPVLTPKDLHDFIDLPYRLYRGDPSWVAPLRSEQAGQFDLQKNPMLEHCTYQLFLARKGGMVVGRIAAFTDQLALEHWREPVGLFGSFECEQNPQAAHGLLEAARNWLVGQGMRAMRGPWSFASQEWGLVVEGFTPSPVILAPYNPPWYNDALAAFGLGKVKDLLVYYIDAREGYAIPERILRLTDKIQQRYGVTTRILDMRRLEAEVLAIVDLANRSIADNWGFYPVTLAEGRAMARDLKDIIHPRGIILAEGPGGLPVGFAMALPDVNQLLKGLDGRLFPTGWLRLLRGLPRLKQYRMWALGVIPEYQGRAIDTLLYRRLYEELYSPEIRMEINYVLEDNDRMNNAIARLGAKPLRRYRVYEREI